MQHKIIDIIKPSIRIKRYLIGLHFEFKSIFWTFRVVEIPPNLATLLFRELERNAKSYMIATIMMRFAITIFFLIKTLKLVFLWMQS